jgi:hypothetical protein
LDRPPPPWSRHVRRLLAVMLFLNGIANVAFGNLGFGIPQVAISVGIAVLEIRDYRRAAKARLSHFD